MTDKIERAEFLKSLIRDDLLQLRNLFDTIVESIAEGRFEDGDREERIEHLTEVAGSISDAAIRLNQLNQEISTH